MSLKWKSAGSIVPVINAWKKDKGKKLAHMLTAEEADFHEYYAGLLEEIKARLKLFWTFNTFTFTAMKQAWEVQKPIAISEGLGSPGPCKPWISRRKNCHNEKRGRQALSSSSGDGGLVFKILHIFERKSNLNLYWL